VTGSGQQAKISLTLSAPNMDLAGFESDGVSLDSIRRGETGASVQLAMVLAGVTYTSSVPVELKANSDQSLGLIRRVK
jgi:hypothetical protein